MYTACLPCRSGQRAGAVSLSEVRLIEMSGGWEGLENAEDVPSIVVNTIIWKKSRLDMQTQVLKTKLFIYFLN